MLYFSLLPLLPSSSTSVSLFALDGWGLHLILSFPLHRQLMGYCLCPLFSSLALTFFLSLLRLEYRNPSVHLIRRRKNHEEIKPVRDP
jgi:hypothetical protein